MYKFRTIRRLGLPSQEPLSGKFFRTPWLQDFLPSPWTAWRFLLKIGGWHGRNSTSEPQSCSVYLSSCHYQAASVLPYRHSQPVCSRPSPGKGSPPEASPLLRNVHHPSSVGQGHLLCSYKVYSSNARVHPDNPRTAQGRERHSRDADQSLPKAAPAWVAWVLSSCRPCPAEPSPSPRPPFPWRNTLSSRKAPQPEGGCPNCSFAQRTQNVPSETNKSRAPFSIRAATSRVQTFSGDTANTKIRARAPRPPGPVEGEAGLMDTDQGNSKSFLSLAL